MHSVICPGPELLLGDSDSSGQVMARGDKSASQERQDTEYTESGEL